MAMCSPRLAAKYPKWGTMATIGKVRRAHLCKRVPEGCTGGAARDAKVLSLMLDLTLNDDAIVIAPVALTT